MIRCLILALLIFLANPLFATDRIVGLMPFGISIDKKGNVNSFDIGIARWEFYIDKIPSLGLYHGVEMMKYIYMPKDCNYFGSSQFIFWNPIKILQPENKDFVFGPFVQMLYSEPIHSDFDSKKIFSFSKQNFAFFKGIRFTFPATGFLLHFEGARGPKNNFYFSVKSDLFLLAALAGAGISRFPL